MTVPVPGANRRVGELALAMLAVMLVGGCGYHLVRYALPPQAGGCLQFDGLEGGGAQPLVAARTSSQLRVELAPDLCSRSAPGATLEGEVTTVEQVTGHHELSATGLSKVGGLWMARATFRIESGGAVVWGPVTVEVERDFFSTGSAMDEIAAMDEHLALIAVDLARAIADVIYGNHPSQPLQ